ncbi:hypothetical protein LTS18_000498, partial [Coniosporium uncinatum]
MTVGTRSGRGRTSESTTPAKKISKSYSALTLDGTDELSRKVTRSSSNNSANSAKSEILVGGKPPVLAYRDGRLLVITGVPKDYLQGFIRSAPNYTRKRNSDSSNQPSSQSLAAYGENGINEEEDEDLAEDAQTSQEVNQSLEDNASSKQLPIVRRKKKGGRQKGWNKNPKPAVPEPKSIPQTGGQVQNPEASIEAEGDEGVDGNRDAPLEDYDELGANGEIGVSSFQQPNIVVEGAEQEDDEPIQDDLSGSDFPPAFLERPPTPPLSECEDFPDLLYKQRYAPLPNPQKFIEALTKFPPGKRTTENLYALALNTQQALKLWQDEYLLLDAQTAPHANPPKKPATGGRAPIDSAVYEAMKESE